MCVNSHLFPDPHFLPQSVRESKALQGLKNDIKNQLNTIPLIQSLAHNSMRPRHWDILMKNTNSKFTPPHEDAAMLLGT